MVSRLFLLLFVAVGIIALVIVYYIYYAYRINKQIRSGEANGRRLPDIPKVLMAAVIVILLIYGILETLLLREITENGTPRTAYASIDTTDYSYLSCLNMDIQSGAEYAAIYSKEENPGYAKEVVSESGYTFTVFTRIGTANSFRPDFLCFVDYEGESDGLYQYLGDATVVDESDMDHVYDTSSYQGDPSGDVLFIGNLDSDTDLVLHYGLLDEAGDEAYNSAFDAYVENPKANEEEYPRFMDYELAGATVRIHVEEEGMTE